jgi:hypothetical protein
MRTLLLKRYGGADQIAFADIPQPLNIFMKFVFGLLNRMIIRQGLFILVKQLSLTGERN